MSRLLIGGAIAGAALALFVVVKVDRLQSDLSKARQTIKERDAALMVSAAELQAEQRASAAADRALAAISRRDAELRPAIAEALQGVADAPETVACVDSPAIIRALDGVRSLEAKSRVSADPNSAGVSTALRSGAAGGKR